MYYRKHSTCCLRRTAMLVPFIKNIPFIIFPKNLSRYTLLDAFTIIANIFHIFYSFDTKPLMSTKYSLSKGSCQLHADNRKCNKCLGTNVTGWTGGDCHNIHCLEISRKRSTNTLILGHIIKECVYRKIIKGLFLFCYTAEFC